MHRRRIVGDGERGMLAKLDQLGDGELTRSIDASALAEFLVQAGIIRGADPDNPAARLFKMPGQLGKIRPALMPVLRARAGM